MNLTHFCDFSGQVSSKRPIVNDRISLSGSRLLSRSTHRVLLNLYRILLTGLNFNFDRHIRHSTAVLVI